MRNTKKMAQRHGGDCHMLAERESEQCMSVAKPRAGLAGSARQVWDDCHAIGTLVQEMLYSCYLKHAQFVGLCDGCASKLRSTPRHTGPVFTSLPSHKGRVSSLTPAWHRPCCEWAIAADLGSWEAWRPWSWIPPWSFRERWTGCAPYEGPDLKHYTKDSSAYRESVDKPKKALTSILNPLFLWSCEKWIFFFDSGEFSQSATSL